VKPEAIEDPFDFEAEIGHLIEFEGLLETKFEERPENTKSSCGWMTSL
jgi:hypothetical protein